MSIRTLGCTAAAMVALTLLAACGGAGSGADGDSYPDGPIEIVAAGSPGGGLDMVARGLAQALEKEGIVESPIRVVNKPGGSMGIGMTYTANAADPDHTLMINAPGVITTPLRGSVEVSHDDFTILPRLVLDEYVVLVPADSPYETLQDLLDAAKDQPGEISVGGAQTGAPDHILTTEIMRTAEVEFAYVPFEGGGEAFTNLIGGHVDVAVGNTSEAGGPLEAGQVRALAAASEERLSEFPDVPTLKESGLDVSASFWRGLMADSEMSPEAAEFWEDAIKRLQGTESWEAFLAQNGMFDGYLTGDESATFISEQEEFYRRTLTDLGMI